MKLNKEEVQMLVNCLEVDRIEGTVHRWYTEIVSIVKKDSGFYKLKWNEGLTENQENEYWGQDAIKVKKVERKVKQTIVEWIET